MGRVSKNDIIEKFQQEFINRFQDDAFSTSIAPGRINLIGEHTDYNLGMAIPIAINRWICSIISVRSDDKINIYASNFKEQLYLNINNLNATKSGWQKYALGCIKIFMQRYNINKGFNVLIGGNVPIGFGMSSSAALEVSLLGALISSIGQPIDNSEILKLSNKVEQEFLGIKSGFLDQYASIFSKNNQPLLIDFSTLSHKYIHSNIKGASWVLINSMVNRSLIDSKYNDRVMECQSALDYINDSNDSKMRINNMTYSHLRKLKACDNGIMYKRIRHLISENERVQLMQQALKKGNLNLIGDILNQCHSSLANDYEVSCLEIDAIINISKKQKGFYGGRIMGGGFGGCTLNLIDDYHRESFIHNVGKLFYNEFKYELKIESVQFSDGFEIL